MAIKVVCEGCGDPAGKDEAEFTSKMTEDGGYEDYAWCGDCFDEMLGKMIASGSIINRHRDGESDD